MKTENFEVLKKLKEQIKETQKYYTGVVKGTRSRYGFLSIDGNKDIFIPPFEMDRVFPGDKVRILVKNDSDTTIEELIETNFKSSIGVFTEDDTGAYVLPEDFGFNRRIRVPKSQKKNAVNNSYVKFEIIEHPFNNKKPKAKIVDFIGEINSIGIESEYVISKNNLRKNFSNVLKKHSESFDLNIIDKEISNRVDLRDLNFITIDGENSLDLDDALYVVKNNNQWKLYVAISDVSFFVKTNDVLDKEAYKRVSSVYFSGKMIPMFPNELSQDLFSLLENKDRLVMVCELDISENGELLNSNFYEAVINSKAKMSYNEVEDFLNGEEEEFVNKYGDLYKNVMNLFNIHQILKNNRNINNIVQGYNEEYKIILDTNKKIKEIVKHEYKVSNKIVEECMIVTNYAAASFIKNSSSKGLFKILYGINPSKSKNLKEFLVKYIDNFSEDMLQSVEGFKTIIECLDMIDPSGRFKKILMSSLNSSSFSEESTTHLGLGFEEYTYFTSPIRRYSDIIVHRMIKDILKYGRIQNKRKHYSEHLSDMTKKIQHSSREVDRWLKSQYMQNFIGLTFEGRVSSVNKYGINIKLVENGVEGFVSISDLLDSNSDFSNATFDEIEHSINTTNEKYSLNDNLMIKVKSVNLENKTIYFELLK